MMHNSRRKDHKDLFINLARPLFHSLIIFFLYFLGYYTRLITDGIPWWHLRIPFIDTTELIRFAIISVVVFIGVGIVKKRYNLTDIGITSNGSFLYVWWQRTIILICLAYFGQGFLFPYGISRLIIGRAATGTLIFIPLFDIFWQRISHHLFKKDNEKILILYREEVHYHNIKDHKRPHYYSVTYVDYTNSYNKVDINNFNTIVLIGSYDKDAIQNIFDSVRLHNQQLYHIADNHFLEDVSYETSKIGNMLALRYRATELEWWWILIKRFFDTIVSALGLAILLPLFIITGIAIKVNSSGPIFYKQTRIGRNMKSFTFVKFRSMYTHLSPWKDYGGKSAEDLYQKLVNSKANVRKWELAKIENDPRVTPVGKFLRATSLDELPSLRNVLMGEMSLVWPRPHMPHEIEKYKARHKRVLSVKPGITGYAQIHGRDTISFDEEAEKELLYLQNWSIFLDLYIILATVTVLFVGKGK